MRQYARRTSVYFPNEGRYVPYPLQNHLRYLERQTAMRALQEILGGERGEARTMADWIEQSFGPTLTELFFGPFHDLYTAGLWKAIAPQDTYKSPIDRTQVVNGLISETPPAGYNATFQYPEAGLDGLARALAAQCNVFYRHQVERIDTKKKEIIFSNGSGVRYEVLISTLPLHRMAEMTDLLQNEKPDPFTSVLVLNIGAVRGKACPTDHWIYVPQSRAGFHRVGFYSNVDRNFLPSSARDGDSHVSIYVERAYKGSERPTEQEISVYAGTTVRELQEWGFVDQIEVWHPTWIETAYTWSRPGSGWKQEALQLLESRDILMAGRYGRWEFQGISESIQSGLSIGTTLKRHALERRNAARDRTTAVALPW
jgi:protoporphyrinogen oxidase